MTPNTAPRTLTVVASTRRVCKACKHPLRLYASIQASTCCCCRRRCGLEVGYGCQVCGRLLTGGTLDAEIGICSRCQLAQNAVGGAALGKSGAPHRHNESA